MSSIDRVWDVICPDRGSEWIHLRVIQDRQTCFVFHTAGSGRSTRSTGVSDIWSSSAAHPIGRLAETIRMFLAIHRAGLPITIADPEEVRLRLLEPREF